MTEHDHHNESFKNDNQQATVNSQIKNSKSVERSGKRKSQQLTVSLEQYVKNVTPILQYTAVFLSVSSNKFNVNGIRNMATHLYYSNTHSCEPQSGKNNF